MRPIDGDRLMMSLADWWYSSFGQVETDESKAIKTVLDKIEQSLGAFTLEKQTIDKCCETCKYKSRSSQEIPCCDCYMSSCFEDCYEPYTEEES